jgi:Zn ribbon nucleic-acid-binding protein
MECPKCQAKMVFSAPWRKGVEKWWCDKCGFETPTESMTGLAVWWKRVTHRHSWVDVRSDREQVSHKKYGDDYRAQSVYVFEYVTYQECSACGESRRVLDKTETVTHRMSDPTQEQVRDRLREYGNGGAA